jgi:hypothetical protein
MGHLGYPRVPRSKKSVNFQLVTRLVTYLNQMRERGYSVWETCMRGTELRVRPVVMTSLTAALGLLPAALANSIGSQAQKPLGIVVVGAMLCTLFLTRYMMPVLYSLFPAPLGHGDHEASGAVVEGTNYSARFMHNFPNEPGARPNSTWPGTGSRRHDQGDSEQNADGQDPGSRPD